MTTKTMAACAACLLIDTLVLASTASAHGPQFQVTNDNGKIVTRQIIPDGPYDTVTDEKLLYLIPVRTTDGVTYARPNTATDALTGAPSFISGPGLAYGIDAVDSSFQSFAAETVLSIGFADPLLKWSGTGFEGAGATELKAYRGSDPSITEPAENFAVTSDDTTVFSAVSLSPIETDYGSEAHGTVRFAFLGDGVSLDSPVQEGLYLATLQVSSSQADLEASDPYYFLLDNGGAPGDISAAVSSLGLSASQVQYVPEPASWGAFGCGLIGLLNWHRARRR